jgi:DNA polymerase-1
MPKRLAIIDGKSVFYRGYYAMPSLATKDGMPTGGVYGFAALSLELFKKLKPDYVAVAWDMPKTNIRKRKEIYPGYKAGRKPAPPDFYEQIPVLHELLEAFGWPLYELDDYEADDIMGALAEQASKQGIETMLITSDLDALQCVGPLTHVYALKRGFTDIDLYDPDFFEAKYGIGVDQFLDLKSLKGDSSDNIPGVPGIGEKTALQLLKEFKTLDNIYDHLADIKESTRNKLIAGKDSAYMSKKIAEIWCDAPVKLDLDALDVTKLDAPRLKTLLTRLEFRSLLRNLPEHMKALEDVELAADREPLEPAKLRELSDAARVNLAMAPTIAVWQFSEDKVVISPKSGEAYECELKDVTDLLNGSPLVVHDGSQLIKNVLATGSAKLPHVEHDTRQAAFLLDPLAKSRELADLVGVSVDDPLVAIEAIWELFTKQGAALEEKPKLAKLAREIDFALIPILARMEYRGIILDTDYLAKMNKELSEKIEATKKEMFELVGYEFNIGSPAQLADVLFGKLQLSTVGIKKGKTGFSTGQKELDKLRGMHPIVELIEKYRELTKLQNTYVESLPKLVDQNSRLHTTFSQDVAATGRLSSHDPNLQNIPVRSELGKKIREAFVPAEGNVFVSADYSQFELRLAAVLAGDKELVEDFNSDIDIHAKTAAQIYHIPLEEVVKDQRRDAKVVNFGVLYGMSPHGLSAATGMSFAEAKTFIDEYFRLRAPIRKYIDDTIRKAKDEGYVETLFGRRRPTPDTKSSNFMVRQGAERAAANMPIQGTEADLMKMAMLEVDKKLDGLGEQLLQIHDSILVECPRDNAEAVSKLLVDTMENIYPELGVKLKVDVGSGNNWGEV